MHYEGIYSFGGLGNSTENSNMQSIANNDMRLMKVGHGPKEWIVLDVAGTPPDPRYFHSMDYFESNNMIVIFGGRKECKI